MEHLCCVVLNARYSSMCEAPGVLGALVDAAGVDVEAKRRRGALDGEHDMHGDNPAAHKEGAVGARWGTARP